MIKNVTTLPKPDAQALEFSLCLEKKIKQEISANGPIPFARFMELALYLPGLGYYTAGLQKFGREGDFITAPQISTLYSKCIAKQCQQILANWPGDILELGAGTGEMAVSILLELENLQTLPAHYYILEVSADLRQRQKELIDQCVPHLSDRVKWIDSLAHISLQGIILANEVMDAFPVHRFKVVKGKLQECYITISEDKFIITYDEPSDALKKYVENLNIYFPEGYESECNLYIQGWIKSVSEILDRGILLLIDYGFPRHEYYHPDRKHGTLMCHYRHQAHSDPLLLVGLQDITAHIDFTTVAQAALTANLSVAGFCNQASFLLSCGIIELLQQEPQETYLSAVNSIKVLTSPNEMGELFKVMALAKNINLPLLGFSLKNIRERL